MAKIKELINFEKIKEVIDIDAITDKDKKGIVEKYVISPALEEYLVHFMHDINCSTHKAALIIGGYGSGKSHLLAFLISLLTEKDLYSYIQNDTVKTAAAAIDRDFAVVHWELQPNDVDLSEYFYDNLETQLADKYGINVNVKVSGVVDHKDNILKTIDRVKQNNHKRGLVVVVDEISDFLKQKTKEKINRDVQFLRVLGQVAQDCDFMFIGAMQEHIFSNPKYVDEAESIGRVAERFQVITIKREDIKRVIATRVLSKTPEQRIVLENLFNEYLKYFPNLRSNLDEYIDLFPLHPYVIQIFSELPYFEKRGIIQFTIQEVDRILDREFPHLITYDLIYDEIESKHTVKNLETVSPVVNAIQTLDSKIDLLDERHQDTARKVVKALAVLKLYGKSTNNGATVTELANTLLVLPGNKLMDATDEITLILNNIRKVTDGQFINLSKDGYYYLDLTQGIDYDQVILRRAENLSENARDDEILAILKDQLQLKEGDSPYAFQETCRWDSKRSFREGVFVYETGKGDLQKLEGDYQIVFVSPFCPNNRYNAADNTMILTGQLDKSVTEELKRLAAAKALILDNYQRSIIEKKYVLLKKSFVPNLIKCYMENGQITLGTIKKSIKSLISREFTNFDELFSELEPELLDDYFKQKYPKHPKFTQAITKDNIKGEFASALKEIINKNGYGAMFSNAQSILKAFDLTDGQGNLSTSQSEAAKKIMELAKANEGKNVDIKQALVLLQLSPYGYDRLMTAFIIVVLTYNGEISLKAAGGLPITSSEIPNTFSSGLDAFESIRYLTLESDFNPQPVIDLFNVLKIDSSKLRVTSKRGEVVQSFRAKYLEIKEQIDFVQKKLESLSFNDTGLLDVAGLKSIHTILTAIPIDEFEKVKTPNDLKKISYPNEHIKEIGQAYGILLQLCVFYKSYFEQFDKEVTYAKEVQQLLDKYSGVFQIEGIKDLFADSFAILANADKLLDPQERNPLLGKLQQIRKKYTAAYYLAHEKYVGNKVNWARLDDVAASKTFRDLKLLKNVSILAKHGFSSVESDIAMLGNLHCADFKTESIENRATCSKCEFPQGYSGKDINAWIDEIENKLDLIYRDWEASILVELNNYRDNLRYLDATESKLIGEIIKTGKLPERIEEQLIIALNDLFRELEIVEVSPEIMIDAIFKETQVMDYYGFERRLADFKQKLTAGKDLDKVRIKLADGEKA